ncbi:acetolactate synthase large subunit [Oceanicola sp. S124]|uniref:acetolactate synthase large subunit n=1 Tax=Oceanicola sp. S124 TaxID=1042378 RepID=UPI00025579FC|nr:acetolactate synthase large subunit [Oceanicola sp. S124]
MEQNGADLVVRTLVENGVRMCFANPGTTEMHMLAALGRTEGMALSLCLFEGVATGAADGYARMTGTPAAVLLHLGPGFANGMANLHNARKAETPLFNIVGEHATYHLAYEAPLSADIEGMAATVSAAVATPQSPGEVAGATAHLLSEVSTGGVATLIVPNDVAWLPAEGAPVAALPKARPSHDEAKLADALEALSAPGAALVIGAPCITRGMAELADAIARKTGAKVLAEAAVARMQRGGGTPPLARIPFHVDPATEALKEVRAAVLCGAREPVAFFAYPGRPSKLLPEGAAVLPLCAPGGEVEATLEALAAALGAEVTPYIQSEVVAADPGAAIDAEVLGRCVARALPTGAIVVDESITNGGHMFPMCAEAPSHDWINNRGGSIGYSMPVALGASTACPERKVLCVTGDGSAFYTLQALWSMARDRRDVTVLVLANRSYRILANETSKIGAGAPIDETQPLMSLEDPAPDWVKLAEGQGVAAERVATAGALQAALEQAMSTPGPRLIEVAM